MKNTSFKIKTALTFGIALLLTIFITRPAFSQEQAKKEQHKKIIMKIVTDDNGKTTIIDTTMEMPDSAMSDSVRAEIEKVIEMNHHGKHSRMKIHKMPEGFSYDFEMPCLPDCPMNMETMEDFDLEGMVPGMDQEDFMWDRSAPGPDCRVMRSGNHGQTLSDILGDIPMDRVVGYTIKDRKNGKRITIDLNDGPMFERQDRVIVIREPARMHRNMNRGDRQVKVIMNAEDDDTKVGKSEDQSVPPPPPPPPPAKPKKK